MILGAAGQWAPRLCFRYILFSLHETTFNGRVCDPILKVRVC